LTSKHCTSFAWDLQHNIDIANGHFIFFLFYDLLKIGGIEIATKLFSRELSTKMETGKFKQW